MTQATLERVAKLALLAAILVELCAYFFSARTLIDHDSLVMAEVARRVVEGESLYRDAWDNKPPLALLFYAPAQAIAPGSYLGQQMFCALWTLLQGVCAFMLLRGESALIRNVVTSLVLLLPLSREDFIWASSEDAVNLFALVITLIGFRILRRGSWLTWEPWLVGAFALIAFHCRQTGLLFAGLPLLAMLLSHLSPRTKVMGALHVAGGGLIGLAIVLAIVVSTSDLGAYVQAVFIGPQRYGATSITQTHWVMREQLVLLRSHPYIPIVLLALLIAEGTRERLFVLAIGALSVIAVLAPSKPFGHYQEQLIPLLVLATLVTLRALQASSGLSAAAYGVALVAFYLGNALITGELMRNDHGEQDELNTVVNMLEHENEKQRGSLLAVGKNSAYIYFRSRVTPVHKQYHWEFFFDADQFLPVPPQKVVDAILKQPPAWLVIDRESYTAYTADGGKERRGQLVHTLCSTRVCEDRSTTPNWHVMSVR